jgi:hypothetical protein
LLGLNSRFQNLVAGAKELDRALGERKLVGLLFRKGAAGLEPAGSSA